jgi:hypothetical protein
LLALALALTVATAPEPPEPPEPAGARAATNGNVRIAILGLRNDGVPPATIAQIVDALALHVSKNPRAEVLTSTEIQAVLGLEATKQTLDCADDGSCAALEEITKGLDVRYVIGGSVAPRGTGALVHLSLVDVQKAKPVARAASEVALDDLADDLAAPANEMLVAIFGAPAPSDAVLLQETSSGLPPLSWIGIATGGLGLAMGAVGGVLWGVDANTISATDTLFEAKEEARGRYAVDQAMTFAGAGVLVVGAGVTALGLVLTE